jgi:hypothetical protein
MVDGKLPARGAEDLGVTSVPKRRFALPPGWLWALYATGALCFVLCGFLWVANDSTTEPSASDLPLPPGLRVDLSAPDCGSWGCSGGTYFSLRITRDYEGGDICPAVEQHLASLGWRATRPAGRSDSTSDGLDNPEGTLTAYCKGSANVYLEPAQPG